ncbi:MAG: hypothetical protein K6E19_10805 [Lachnospiraceae bacterium]|nr:hypothetical protein [Lachnospiraceae bacterium]
MNKYNLSEDLFSNIDITDNGKRELYNNCKKGKRAGDLRFKYAKVLTALIIMGVAGSTGITANAFYTSVKARMESMSEEERADYVYELENNTEVTMDGNWSRSLSNKESLRMAELERKYNSQSVFPEKSVEKVESLNDWDGSTVCFVEEDNQLHIPAAEMNDEQLLQLVDYSAKTEYMIEEQAKEYNEESGFNNPYVDIDTATEEDLINLGYNYLKDFIGKDLPDGWNARVKAFKPSNDNPEYAPHDMYTIYWEQEGGSTASTGYQVALGMHDLHLIAVAIDGREHWATLGSYTDEEALEIAETVKPKIYKILADKYGFTKIDRERHEAYHVYDDYGDTRQLRYIFQSGETVFEITWDISTEELALFEIWPEGDSFEPDYTLE